MFSEKPPTQACIAKFLTLYNPQHNEITALPIIEITTPENTWYDYQHRYTPNYSQHIIPANIPSAFSRHCANAELHYAL